MKRFCRTISYREAWQSLLNAEDLSYIEEVIPGLEQQLRRREAEEVESRRQLVELDQAPYRPDGQYRASIPGLSRSKLERGLVFLAKEKIELQDSLIHFKKLLVQRQQDMESLRKGFPCFENPYVREIFEDQSGNINSCGYFNRVSETLNSDQLIRLCVFLSTEAESAQFQVAILKILEVTPTPLKITILPLLKKYLSENLLSTGLLRVLLTKTSDYRKIDQWMTSLLPILDKYIGREKIENVEDRARKSNDWGKERCLEGLIKIIEEKGVESLIGGDIQMELLKTKYPDGFQSNSDEAPDFADPETLEAYKRLLEKLPMESANSLEWGYRCDLVKKVQLEYLDPATASNWPSLIKAGIKPADLFQGFLTSKEAHRYLQEKAQKGKLAFSEVSRPFDAVAWTHGLSDDQIKEELNKQSSLFSGVYYTFTYDSSRDKIPLPQARIIYDWIFEKMPFLNKTHKMQQAGGLVLEIPNGAHLDELNDLLRQEGFERIFPQGIKTSAEDVIGKLREFHEVQKTERLKEQLDKESDQELPQWTGSLHPAIKQITKSHDLIREGIEMDHCVGGYVDQCLRGHTFIFHCGPACPGGSTVEANLDRNGVLRVHQNYGYKDSVASPLCQKFVDEWKNLTAEQERKTGSLVGRLRICSALLILQNSRR